MSRFKSVLTLISIIAILYSIVAANDEKPAQEPKKQSQPRRYGQAEVSEFVRAGEGLEFVCCIDDWPDIIGKNITVVIDQIQQPQYIGDDKAFYHSQVSKYLEENLKSAKITLSNIQRSPEKFAIIADVRVDELYLAAELIKQGLAEIKKEPPAEKIIEKPVKLIPRPTEPPPELIKPLKSDISQADKDTQFVASSAGSVFHKISCHSAQRIKEENLVRYKSRDEAIADGKRPCQRCKP